MSDMTPIPAPDADLTEMFSEYLAQSRAAVAECFRLGQAESRRCAEDTGIPELWFDYHLMAAKLIHTSLAVADRMPGAPRRDFNHRITVERVSPAADPLPLPGTTPSGQM
jgi:hypothetical protein